MAFADICFMSFAYVVSHIIRYKKIRSYTCMPMQCSFKDSSRKFGVFAHKITQCYLGLLLDTENCFPESSDIATGVGVKILFFFRGLLLEKKKVHVSQFTGAIWGFTRAIYNIMILHPILNTSSHDTLERFSKNRQEEENTITFRLKCIVIA